MIILIYNGLKVIISFSIIEICDNFYARVDMQFSLNIIYKIFINICWHTHTCIKGVAIEWGNPVIIHTVRIFSLFVSTKILCSEIQNKSFFNFMNQFHNLKNKFLCFESMQSQIVYHLINCVNHIYIHITYSFSCVFTIMNFFFSFQEFTIFFFSLSLVKTNY